MRRDLRAALVGFKTVTCLCPRAVVGATQGLVTVLIYNLSVWKADSLPFPNRKRRLEQGVSFLSAGVPVQRSRFSWRDFRRLPMRFYCRVPLTPLFSRWIALIHLVAEIALMQGN